MAPQLPPSSKTSCFSSFWTSALRSKPINPPSVSSSGDELVRRLGLFDLILIGIGASIGAGIFVVTGTVAHDSGPGVTISFVVTGVCCMLNALCYAELSTRFPPVVGGAYLYTYSAFNELTAFLLVAQLMVDYHVAGASIARSLASYIITVLELIPALKGVIPDWIGHGKVVHGALSINLLAPIILLLITLVLCRGVGESSLLNSIMTITKVIIVLFVIIAGSFKVDVSNWTPFVPNGLQPILTGATIAFFAYTGFDAVANSAEESKNPQRDLPWGIIVSLLACAVLYIAVCLVITGMVPYNLLGDEAPLATAFTSNDMKYVTVIISFGAVAGLTTTLLVGLYIQSRLYLGIGRDGLIPAMFSKVHPKRHTPIHSQVWIGVIDGIMAGLLNVSVLSHFLSVGTLVGLSVVSACVITLRWQNKPPLDQASGRCISSRTEGTVYLLAIASCGFAVGVLFQYKASYYYTIFITVLAIIFAAALHLRLVYCDPPGFSCPLVPIVPSISIWFNMFLFAQLHHEAWVRFVVLGIISLGVYAFYGQFHAKHVTDDTV